MKNITFLIKPLIIVVGFLITSNSFSQITIDSEDFESGWGIWTDGGTNTDRLATSPPNNSYSIEMKNSSGAQITSNNLDLTSYGIVDITFDFEFSGMGNNEGFQLYYSSNGGANWTLLSTYYVTASGNSNNTAYSATFSMDSNIQTYTSTVRLQFRNKSNKDTEISYVDNILIEAYAPLPEIDITGLGNSISNGDTTPDTLDDTDWGTVGTGSTTTHTFTIENTIASALSTLTISNAGSGITITGGSGYFSINTEPAQNATLSGGSSTTFSIDFNPLVNGTYTATEV